VIWQLVVLLALCLVLPFSAWTQEPPAPPRADELEFRQMDFANGWLLRGNYIQAVREYEKFLAAYPNSLQIALACSRLGEAQYFLKNYAQAEEAFSKALPLVTDYDKRRHLQYRLGEVKYHLTKYAESVDLLSTVLLTQPKAEIADAALFYKGQSLVALGHKDEAAEAFQQIIDKYPNQSFVFFASHTLGVLYRERGDLDKALQIYGVVRKATPGDPRLPGSWLLPEAEYRRGEILYEQGKFQESAEVLKKAISSYPSTDLRADMQYSLGWSYFGVKDYTRAIEMADALISSPTAAKRIQGIYLLRGNSQYELGNYTEAAGAYEECTRRLSGSEESRKQASEALARLAWCHYFAGKYDASLAIIAKASGAPEAKPFLGDLTFLKGQILYLQENYEKALLEFLDVLANYKESRFHREVGYRLGWAYYKLEQFKEAAEVWFTFALKYPEEEMGREAALMAGEATFKAGNFEQALERFDHYITTYSQMPESETVLYRASVACYNIQKYDKMSTYLKQLIERFPNTQFLAETYYWLGFAASSAEQPAEAEKYFALLVQAQPTSDYAPDALYRLGKIYYQSQRTKEALDSFLKIVKEYPKYVLAAEILQWLGSQLFEAQSYDDAYQAYVALYEKYPGSELKGRAQFEAGRCLMELNKFDEAQALYSQMLSENSAGGYRGLAGFGLGKALMAKKNYADALKNLGEAQNLLSDEWASHAGFLIGICHRESGQWQEAFEAFMRVSILYDDARFSAEALWQAGQAKEKLDDWPEAEKTYRELLDRYSETNWAQKARDLLNARASTSEPVSAGQTVPAATQ